MRRWTLFTIGLGASAALTAVLWVLDVPGFFLFLFFPLLLFPFKGRAPTSSRRCPACGFESDDPAVQYCPHDGGRLQEG